MKRRFRDSLRRRMSTGTALVLTLFFVLLISALVVALLISMRLDRSNTQGYYQSARAQELANGALEEIAADLRCEMNAGSLDTNTYIVNGKRVYVPNSSLSSQPARIGFAAGTNFDYANDVDSNRVPPTLIRVSRANFDTNLVYPTTSYDQSKLPPVRASAVSTTNYSANYRTISPKRWNSSYLLSGSISPPSKFSSQPPEWVYITRAGSRPLDPDQIASFQPSDDLNATNTVLGRYAYVIYDEGGLLDINSVGFPSTISSGTAGPAAIRGKSSSIYAALASLPGLSGKTNEIDTLVNWRGKGSIAAAGNFLSAATNWARHGFLCMTNGDSPLLSRKDLIDYFTKKMGTTTPLPYLGTFSRALTAPSVRPVIPTGATAGYYDQTKFNTTGTNRDLANVRFSGSASVKHWFDDATSKTYSVEMGDPLLQNRFSLSRLAWLERANPDTGAAPPSPYAEAIKSAFGLVWDYPGGASGSGKTANGGNKCWNYVGATGDLNAPPGTIKTLDQVATEGREPDFFELLKAAILAGSLGKTPGPAAFDNGKNTSSEFNYANALENPPINLKMGPLGFYSYTLGPLSSVPAPGRISDMQIIKIGANIIDQYDADSYPTAIYFRYAGSASNDPATTSSGLPIFGPVTMAYGTENLPYLAFVRQVNASLDRPSSGMPARGTDLTVNAIAGWMQPYLWNPHQQPAQTPSGRPTNFQIRAYGSVKMVWNYDPNPVEFHLATYKDGVSPPVNYYQMNDNSETCDAGTINFSDSPSTSQFYGKPFPLLQDSVSSPSSNDPKAYSDGNTAFSSSNMSLYGTPSRFVAFSTGETPKTDMGGLYRPFYVLDVGTKGTKDAGFPDQSLYWDGYASISNRPDSATPAITYALGWKDSSGKFHPYSYMTGSFGWTGAKLYQDVYVKNQTTGELAPRRTGSLKVGAASPDEISSDMWMQADPRTDRFSMGFSFWGGFAESITQYRSAGQRFGACGKPIDPSFSGIMYGQKYRTSLGDYMVNSGSDTTHVCYYSDPDGVVRPGDGFYGNPATGDGLMTFIANGVPTGSPVSAGDKTVAKHGRLPVILNRPFQSVAELGYVFRDLPFKSLDFFSDKSADTALLDVFSLNDVATAAPDRLLPVAAGRINPNSASVPVLKALFQGGAKKELDSTYNLQAESDALAKTFAAKIMQGNSFTPLPDHRELVPALTAAMRAAATTSADQGNKTYLEAPLRALSESLDVRTWNLMIDVIAQSGQFAPNAKTLSDFTVQAECRVWLHIAIDRYTGEVLARQLEPVYE